MTKRIAKRAISVLVVLAFAALSLIGLGVFAPKTNAVFAAPNASYTLGESKPVITNSYVLPDNSGYNPIGSPSNNSLHPLGGQFATISVDALMESGVILQDTYNGFNSYAFVAGDKVNNDNNRAVEIKLTYNYPKTTSIRGTKWEISDDSYKQPINGVQVGVVGTGALIVQKSFDGQKWEWTNSLTDGTATNFHTTNFTTHFSPVDYDGTPHEVTYKQAYLGEDGNVAEKEVTELVDGKLVIYSPAGAELSKGIYLKISFAYEIKYSTIEKFKEGGFLGIGQKTVERTVWHYANILEESVFYLANGSGEVAFTNAIVEEITDAEGVAMSESVRMAGSIRDGHGSNNGFRLNTLGNDTYDIKYSKNGSSLKTAVHGEFFSDPGKYEFRVTTRANTVNVTTLYINERGVNQNIKTYFGDSLFTANSERVFSTGDAIPVYVAGQAWYKTLPVDINHMPINGVITNLDTDEKIIVGGGEDRRAFTGLLSKPGNYMAEFANNKDYFNSSMSGDCYHFVFQFVLIDPEDNPGPIINSELLQGNLSVSDYASGYYGVETPSKGTGIITFAFIDFASAYDFAYSYQSSLVVVQNNRYTYKNVVYNNQFDVLEVVCKTAEESVLHKYFDTTDPYSYLTIQNPTDDILSQSFSCNIVVFSDIDAASDARAGEPFLNDRRFSYLSDDGTIVSGVTPIRFIQVANFESDSVQLVHELTGWKTMVSYGAPVQSVLEGKNAPSGRYKIIEKNIYGDATEYYAIYIKPGELTTSLIVDRFLNGSITAHTLTRAEGGVRFNANSFVLRMAVNKLDPFGIVKIEKIGTSGYTKVYSLDEIEDIVISEAGNFIVHIADRLGNTIKYYFDIVSASEAHTLTLANNGNTHAAFMAFEGQRVILPILENTGLFEFKGWLGADGVRYNDIFTFNQTSDTTLTAVWHYAACNIEIFDGARIKLENAKPEQRVVLPTVTKDGYTLYGFSYAEPDGTIRFYRGQITSVPNVSSMCLDAVWIRNASTIIPQVGAGNQIKVTLIDGDVVDTLTATKGGEVALPQPMREGLIFAGWVYQSEPLSGLIFTTKADELPNVNSMTLSALWKTDSTQGGSGQGGAAAGTVSGGSNNGSGLAGLNLAEAFSLQNISIMLMVTLALCLLFSFNRIVSVFRAMVSRLNSYRKQASFRRVRLPRVKSTRRGFFKVYMAPAVSLLLVVVFAFVANWKLPASLQEAHLRAELAAAQEDFYNAVRVDESLSAEELAKREDYIARATEAYTQPLVSGVRADAGDDGVTLTDAEIFLASLVFLDLLMLGYEAFPAIAVKTNSEKVYGLAYSNYEDAYQNTTDGKIYFGVGFVALPNQSEITDEEVDDGIEILPEISEDELEVSDEVSSSYDLAFILSFQEEYDGGHYIASGEYIRYDISNYAMHCTALPNEQENYDLTIGYLYSYDLGRPVYDPDLGKDVAFNGYSIVESLDYDFIYNSYRAFIAEQASSGLSVDTVTVTFISNNVINEYIANNQDESFLGLSAEEIYSIESQIADTHFYVILPNGEFEVLELPVDPPPKASLFERIIIAYLAFLAVVTAIVVGIVISVATCGAGGVAALMAAGALAGAAIELFMQVTVSGVPLSDVNWMKVGVSALSGALCAIPGVGFIGAALIGGATNAAMAYIDGGSLVDCLLAFGLGVATGVLIHFGGKLISKVSKSIQQSLNKCFVAGTAVLVAVNGVAVFKKIEDIRLGDKVYSYNEFTNLTEIQEVTQIFRSVHTELVKVTTSDGQTISSSLEHPYYTNRGWIQADKLRAGDILQTVNGERVVVELVQHEILDAPQILYNFEVQGNHNYYVAENTSASKADFVLVHNSCHKVYMGLDKISGKPYVGRTSRDLAKRMSEHAKSKTNPRLFDLDEMVFLGGLTKNEARGLEQALINKKGTNILANRINGISQSNPVYNELVELGEALLKKFPMKFI